MIYTYKLKQYSNPHFLISLDCWFIIHSSCNHLRLFLLFNLILTKYSYLYLQCRLYTNTNSWVKHSTRTPIEHRIFPYSFKDKNKREVINT